MSQTYRRIIFSGKEVLFRGIREGDGKLYGGDGVEFCVNLVYESSTRMRSGQKRIENKSKAVRGVLIAPIAGMLVGDEIWSEKR
jgi:hypothetical protein